ncbi:hypothetical protein ACLQ20_08675 [Micromonospora sp. DT46]|uniref:hypothetical protein n=1 Tax=Micromonospora sp. DT46 TaxID=3393435 RepID=UPI003CEC95A3
MADMLAGRLHLTERALRMESVPVPEPQNGQVRVRVEAAEVCLSDVQFRYVRSGRSRWSGGL